MLVSLAANVALAQEHPNIVECENGRIVWENPNPALYYTVEWTPALVGTSEWTGSFRSLQDLQSPGAFITAAVPMCFRVVGTSTQSHTRTLSPDSTLMPAGYYEATDLSAINPNLSPSNIRAGVSIFGIEGEVSDIYTRIISLSGDLNYGDVYVTMGKTLTIRNQGDCAMTVYGLDFPDPAFSGNWTGRINVGSTRDVTVWFTPAETGRYAGVITVNSDATGGTNTISCTGTGKHVAVRFVDHGDGTVSDAITGLMWPKNGNFGTASWNGSITIGRDLVLAGYDDWHAPTVAELLSIGSANGYGGGPWTTPGLPFTNVQAAAYWSGEGVEISGSWYGYWVNLASGNSSHNNPSMNFHTWPVRSGPPATSYWFGAVGDVSWFSVSNWYPLLLPGANTSVNITSNHNGYVSIGATGAVCRLLRAGAGPATDLLVEIANGSLNVGDDVFFGMTGFTGWSSRMVIGDGGLMIVADDFTVGDNAGATNWAVEVESGGQLIVNDLLLCRTGGVVTLDGGEIRAGTIGVTGGVFNFVSGSLYLTRSDLRIGTNAFLGLAFDLDASKSIVVPTNSTLVQAGGMLTISGGSLTTRSFDSSTGAFHFTGGSLTVSGGTFRLGRDQLVVDGAGSPSLLLHGVRVLDTYSAATSVLVGAGQQGSLTLAGGTDLGLGPLTHIGQDAGSFGQVLMTGVGTTCTGAEVIVGVEGAGWWGMDDVATAEIGDLWIGRAAGSTGDVVMSGAGTVLSVSNLTLGAGAASLTVSGGTLAVSSTLTVPTNGTVNLLGGLFAANTVSGSLVSAGAVISPHGEAIGTMTVTSNLTLGAGATLLLDLCGTQHDVVAVGGAFTMGGTLELRVCDQSILDPGDSLDLLGWGSASGSFDATNLPAPLPGRVWDLSTLYTDGKLRVAGDGSASVMTVFGNGHGVAAGSMTPSETNGTLYEKTLVIGGTLSHTFTITNSGDAALNIYHIHLAGAHPADFIPAGISLPVTLAPGEATNFTLTFDPTDDGVRTATVMITNDVIGAHSYDFAVQGEGVHLPLVETYPATYPGPNRLGCGGYASNRSDGFEMTVRGFCWNSGGSPTTNNNVVYTGGGDGEFYETLTNVAAGSLTYIRAFAAGPLGVSYGTQVTARAQYAPPHKAFNCNPYTDYAIGSWSITGALPRTIEAWAFLRDPSTEGGLFSSGVEQNNRDFSLRAMATTNTWRIQLYGANDIDVVLNGSHGSWHHYALTYDGTSVRLYYDGTLATQRVVALDTGAGNFQIGRWGGLNFFKGWIDDVRVWDIARTETEIRDNMHLALTGSESNLYAYYQLDYSYSMSLNYWVYDHSRFARHLWLGGTRSFEDSGAPLVATMAEDAQPRAAWPGRTNSLVSDRLAVVNAAVTGLHFAVFGHDSAAADALNTTDVPAGIAWRLERVWEVGQKGAVAGRVRFDTTGLAFIGTGARLCLLVSESPSFTNANSVPGSLAAPWFTSDAEELQDGRYYTLALQDAAPGELLNFPGTNAYVNCGPGPTCLYLQPRTIEAWAYARSFNDGGLFQAGLTGSAYNDFSFRTLTTENQWRINTWFEDIDVTLPDSRNRWHHYAVVFDSSRMRLYYDGTLVVDQEKALWTEPNDFLIGRWADNYFDGLIDELRVWNTARTQDQIRDHMHRQLVGNEIGLRACYRFNEGGGTNVFDRTTNGHHGTLIGNVTWTNSTFPCAWEIASRSAIRGAWLPTTNSLPSSILSISNAAVTGVNFRVVGHDAGTLTANTMDKPANILWRLDRAWRAEGEGALTADVVFDCSAIGGLITDTDNLRLLSDADGVFTNATASPGVYAGSLFTVSTQAVQNGMHYTLGESDD